MHRSGHRQDESLDVEQVFQTLDDQLCREIITQLEEPQTVTEIAESCDIPLSTTYRKVERLQEASLVSQQTEIRQGGHHRARYRVDFVTIFVLLSNDQSIDIEVERPVSDPEDGLLSLWSELRRETVR